MTLDDESIDREFRDAIHWYIYLFTGKLTTVRQQK